MSYVFHTDAYKAEDALGMYEGQRCLRCGDPMPKDFYVTARKRYCDKCLKSPQRYYEMEQRRRGKCHSTANATG